MPNQSDKITDEEKEYYALMKRVFDKLAPFYDIVTVPFSRVRDKVVSFVDAGDGSRVLDVATGTGKQAFAFARRGYDVTGVDLSEAMLKIAKRKNKYGNARFEVADASNLPFADKSFDVTCVSLALHEMPATIREKTLQEMLRVTRARGVLVIIDYALPQNRIGRFFIYHLVELYESEHYSKFIKSDLEAWLRKSGIEIKGELPIAFGAGRILKGIRADNR